MADKKERAVKTISNVFEWERSGVYLVHLDILDCFYRNYAARTIKPGVVLEKMVKVGDATGPLNLSINVSADPTGKGSICDIYEPEFAREALVERRKYRIIYHPKEDGIYKVVDKFFDQPGISEPKDISVISCDREPIFKIEISSSKWATRQMTIKDYEGVCTFMYAPDLESRPRNMLIRTFVPKKSNGEKEKLYKRIFLDFHRKLKDKCLELGMTPAEKDS